MLSIRILLTTLFLLFLSTTAANASELDGSRTVHIDGFISHSTLEPVTERLGALLADKSDDDVNIIINSPGGEVTSGFQLINRMTSLQGRGITINCWVKDLAASMAFQILTVCDNRYALHTSFLLWHGVRTSTMEPITVGVATAMLEDLRRFDDMVLQQLDATLGMSKGDVRRHFVSETLWFGKQLHAAAPRFITTADSYPEIDAVLLDKKVVRSAKGFFMSDPFDKSQSRSYILHSTCNKCNLSQEQPNE